MPRLTYNWKRFWCPRAGTFRLDEEGYLHDPDSEWGRAFNPDVVPFESIAANPCLVLLGEPGIGKSFAMQQEQSAVERQVKERGGQLMWLDLRSYSSEDRLVSALFESPVFTEWAGGTHELHLFLDSLDECLLRVDNVAILLADELRKYPTDRLYLRVACRTADWPHSFERDLRGLWGQERVGVYELAPLRPADVVEAAKTNGLDATVFTRQIATMGVVPLAIKPVTLDLLINAFRQTGQFPGTQTELYRQGCRLLCEEPSDRRRDAGLTGELSAEQRLAVASRIAAVTIFCGRYAVWTELDRGDVPPEDVTIEALSGGREIVRGSRFEIQEAAVRETLRTGLFSSRGSHRIGWGHQTYAEFLAALYLAERDSPLKHITSILTHPGDPESRIVPQLHETAAWLAGMRPDVFRHIMQVDPEVLLHSDVAKTDVQDRVALVDNLLQLYEGGRSFDRWADPRGYSKLKHPGLAAQLRPFVTGSEKSFVTRRVAINIAQACHVSELQDDLVTIALDPAQPISVRVEAASTVSRIGDEATTARLKPLAAGQPDDDPDDELKGFALRALWPGQLTAVEFLEFITPPKRTNFLGAYQGFLLQDHAADFQPADLPRALEWVEEKVPRVDPVSSLRQLANGILWKSWEHLDAPGVLKPFSRIVLVRLRDHDEISDNKTFKQALAEDDDRRRLLLEVVIPSLPEPEKNAVWLVYSQTPVALPKDVPWMVGRLLASKSADEERAWAALIRRAFDWRDQAQAVAIFHASQRSSVLSEGFRWLLQPIDLRSEEAAKMKADYLESKKWERKHQDRPLLQPPPAERILRLLGDFESGKTDGFWLLNMDMTLEPHSTHYEKELEPDLTSLPGWQTADDVTRRRIVNASKEYVLNHGADPDGWLGKNTYNRPALAGYRALRLLLMEDADFLSAIPNGVWGKWASIVLAYPVSGDAEEKVQQALVRTAYRKAHDEIIRTLLVLIDRENEQSNRIWITRKMRHCWDERLATTLLDKVRDQSLKPSCMGSLLVELLDHDVPGAREFAESLIPAPLPTEGDARARAIEAAQTLMTHAGDAGWQSVWRAVQQDAEFGRAVIMGAAADFEDRHATRLAQRLDEAQLADLYVWVTRQFPHSEDPSHENAHWVSPRDSVAMWRDSLLRRLLERGTYKACEEIQRIARELPQLDWLKWVLLDAQRVTRRKTWVSPRPSDILKLTGDPTARLVNSGEQLLEVLTESLRRLEAKLQGETPAAIDLWNEVEKGLYRPKDENRLSDYIKRHLDDDLKATGVIVNREVEIRRGSGGAPGERPDIHVDAVLKVPHQDVYGSISAIIEVKGSWNSELKTAMKDQLVDRYLADNRCRHGLYVVGWFDCDQWDDSDPRKHQAPSMSPLEAQRHFDGQAHELSQADVTIIAVVVNTGLR